MPDGVLRTALAPDGTMRVLIVDDESFNRLRLQDLLSRARLVDVVGTAADGYEAVERIRSLRPDLVLLDVQMPEKTGIDVVREIGPANMPATIFVTAHDRYAVEAFELAAVDYLVKPFDDERFAEALDRARRALTAEGVSRTYAQLLAVLAGRGQAVSPSGAFAAPGTTYLERIAVEIHGVVRPVMVSEIDYITSDGPYAELHVGTRRFVIREAMQTLEERLDPRRFMRVHRSVIIRLDLVESMKRAAGGDGEVLLKGGLRLRVSRTRREALERWLGITS